jgi:predicted outer membrane repeat protein
MYNEGAGGINPTLTNVTFISNTATNGGGMYNIDSGPTLTDVTFSGNTATNGWGGGMYNEGAGGINPTLTNVTFSGNTAGAGGGMYNYSSSPTLTNVTFSGNTATYDGGGMYNYGSSPTLTDVTFSGNSATNHGGGMYNDYGFWYTPSSPTLGNCILWGNVAPSGAQLYNAASYPDLPDIAFSDIQGSGGSGAWGPYRFLGLDGGGNIDADPLFVDADAGDLHLRLESPAVDRGNNDYVTVTTDLDGYPRVRNGQVDMGAYEFQYPVPPNPIYVDVDATGARDGSDWSDALTSLRAALAWAGAGVTEHGQQEMEIWVAEGVYKPIAGGFREATFELHSSVAVYGGFAGSEISRDDRNWVDNDTILSGDIKDQGVNSDNSYHVVTGSGVTGTAVLDGFTITGGNANHADPPLEWGGGMYLLNSNLTISNTIFISNRAIGGGGMFSNGGQPVLVDVEFSQNNAPVNGGGLHTYNGSSPALTNVTFISNTAEVGGGGMLNDHSSPTLTGITFTGNHAGWGGGLHNYYSSPTLTGVTFSGNTATTGAGGMRNDRSNPKVTNAIIFGNTAASGGGMHNDYSNPVLTNVTFSGNAATGNGGGMFNQNYTPKLRNCILWGNAAPSGPEIYNSASTPDIAYSDIRGSGGGGEGNIDDDPLFVDQAAGGLRLQLTSPAIDAGDNEVPGLSGILTDLGGNPRFADVATVADTGHGWAPIVDMGAYEAPLSPIYVNLEAEGNGNGGSWVQAFTDLQDALTWAVGGVQVWVAEGTYFPTAGTDRTVTFQLVSGVAVYGGFAGNETSRDERDWVAHQTILSGDIGTGGDNSDNSYHVLSASSAVAGTVLDGFTVTGGNANHANAPLQSGGGMYLLDSNPTIRHVVFEGNSAERGGGIYGDGGQPVLLDVEFSHNSAATSGGGMYNESSSPTAQQITVTHNTAFTSGGGMYSAASSPVLLNAIVFSNTADYGGGLYNQASGARLTNVTLRRNRAIYGGGGMYNLDCFGTNTPELVNVLFTANVATDAAQGSGGGMYNQGSSPELTNVTLAHNTATHYGGGMANLAGGVAGTSNPTLRNSVLWGNTGLGTIEAQQVYNADQYNQPVVQASTIQDEDVASPFVDADGADNIPGTADDDLHPTYPSYGIVDGGGDDFLPADEFDLDGDGNATEALSLDLAGNARIYADYGFDGQADDPAILESDLIDQVDRGAYEAGCHPWHMTTGDGRLAEGRQYRTGFHSDLVEVDPGETISGTLESYASQQAGDKFDQAWDYYEAALACAGTVTQTNQALLGLQNVLWEQATAAMLRGNEEMVQALDVTVAGGVGGIEDDIAALERAAGLYDQATDGYLRASLDFPPFLAALPVSRTLPITYTEVFTQVDVLRLAMAAAKKSRAVLELGELQFRSGDGAQAGQTLSQGYGEALYELNLLSSLWPAVAETVDYVTLVQNLGGMDRLYSYLQSGKNPFGYGPEFVPFHYRPDKDPERGSNNFEHTHWLAENLYLAPAIADATQAEASKRMFDDDYTTYQAKLNDVESTYNSELEILCGTTGGGAPDLDVCDGGTIQEQYQKVLGAKLRVEQVLVQMEMNNERIRIEQQRAADLCEIEEALAEVMLENGEELAVLGEQEARLRFAKSESQGILGIFNGILTGAFGGAAAVGEMSAAPKLSFASAGVGAVWGGFNAYLDWKYQKEVAEQIGDVWAQKERIYALEKAQVQYANCDKVQAESLAHLKTIVLEFANLEMEHAIAMNELLQALSRLNGLTSRAEYLLAEKARARAFTQLLYQDPAGRVLRNHLMEQAYFSFEQALQYGFRAGRALDYEINNDVPYSGYPAYPLRTLDDLYAINSTDELSDGLLQMVQAWEDWTAGRFPESRTAIVYLSRALFESYEDPTTGETVTAREQLNALIRGRPDPDALTLQFETSILQGNKFLPTWYYNDRIDSIKMRVRGTDLSLCPQPPQYVDVNLLQAGTSFIRTEDATLKRVESRIEIDVEDIGEYDLEPKSVSVQAALNDDPFPDPGGTIRGLKSRSVAFADWKLTIDTTQGAENPCLNLDHIDEIELHIVRQAYDLPLPAGAEAEEELLAAIPVEPYQPSQKVLPPISLGITAPEWRIPGLSAPSGAVNLNGAYVGTIVISQPVYLPPVDLALLLTDVEGSLSGTLSPTLSYPAMPGTNRGPEVSGAWNGEGFTLESEVFTTVITTGVVISHQVLLHTGVISDSGGVLSGVYSETLTGLTPEPLVILGEFWLVRPQPSVTTRVYLPLLMKSAP